MVKRNLSSAQKKADVHAGEEQQRQSLNRSIIKDWGVGFGKCAQRQAVEERLKSDRRRHDAFFSVKLGRYDVHVRLRPCDVTLGPSSRPESFELNLIKLDCRHSNIISTPTGSDHSNASEEILSIK